MFLWLKGCIDIFGYANSKACLHDSPIPDNKLLTFNCQSSNCSELSLWIKKQRDKETNKSILITELLNFAYTHVR